MSDASQPPDAPAYQGPLVVIAGPTATGKTATALALARRLGGELVGADSVQVYRGFDIGSGKPTAAELGDIRHHLIDVADPDRPIDAMTYAALADRAIADVASRGALPLVVGGTGLWLRALVRGLVSVPPADAALRKRLMAEVQSRGSRAAHQRLAAVDPRAAQAIHENDQVRIVRALEVYEQTGRPLGDLWAEHALGAPRYRMLFVVVDLPRAHHDRAVAERVRAMLAAGWIEEVAALRRRWGDEARPLGSVGYRQVVAHLRDGVAPAETEQSIVRATRVYARRQRTWFSSEPGVDLQTDPAQLLGDQMMSRIQAFVAGTT